MYEVKVTIKGISPLLFNRFIQAELEGKSKKQTGADKEKDPSDKLYKLPDDNGTIYTPATHLEGMLVNAAKNFKIKGKGKSTFSKLVGSSVAVIPDAIPHKIQKWDVFRTTCVNPNTRGRMIVDRPKMPEWELDFTIKVMDDGIPDDVLKQIIDYGGNYVGIGDWRPDNKGKFGKFMVTKYEKLNGQEE